MPAVLNRTVVFFEGTATNSFQNLFIRGGVDHGMRPGCTDNATVSACAITILHRKIGTGPWYEKYNSWKLRDRKLDWYGAEAEQGVFSGTPAMGTPTVMTSNVVGEEQYQPINTYGNYMWLVDFLMACDETVGGWFDLKGLDSVKNWEVDINQHATCGGNAGSSTPYASINHVARCGYINVFTWNGPSCHVDKLDD